MGAKRRGFLPLFAGVLCVLVCLLFFVSRHHPPPKPRWLSRETRTTIAPSPDPGSPSGRGPTEWLPAEVRNSFGILVWPGMSTRAIRYSKTIASWIKDWGLDCRFAMAHGGHNETEARARLPADLGDNAWNLDDLSLKFNGIIVADGDLPRTEVTTLRKYLLLGSWLLLSPPEKGRLSADVEELLQLKPSRTIALNATSMSADPELSSMLLGPQGIRLLVSHPSLYGLVVGQWAEWMGPSGKILYSKRDEALPLLCFRRPEVPALRLAPFGDGGIIHWNFLPSLVPLIEDMDSKALLSATLAWLVGRDSWAKPTEKEGTVSGVVREVKDGPAISGARVTAVA